MAASAAALAAEAASLSEAAWQARVHGIHGKAHPAWFTLIRRLSEVEIHHVDLDIGYLVAGWPDSFVADLLPGVAEVELGRPVVVDAGAGDAGHRKGLKRDLRQKHWGDQERQIH